MAANTTSTNQNRSPCDDVVVAVHHLNDLAEHMKCSRKHDALEADLRNLDTVVTAIQQLAEEYSSLLEKLECESIKASVLRHRLKIYPQVIKDEIQQAIDAARFSNAVEQTSLNQMWEAVECNIAELERTIRLHDADSSRLVPERDEACRLHNTTMSQLNQCMSDKAAMQIVLNETRERVCDTNREILELEDGIAQLKEDMIKERAVFRQHRKRLHKLISNTSLKLQMQQEANENQKAEMEQVFSGMKKLSDNIEQLAAHIIELDGSRTQLEIKEENLQSKHDEVMHAAADIRSSLDKLNADLARETATFVKNKAHLEDRTIELSRVLEVRCKESDVLKARNDELMDIIKEKVKVKESDQQDIQGLNKVVQQQKDELAKTAQNTAQLQVEMVEIDEAVSELLGSHGAVLESLKKTADESRKLLGKERQERMELDAELEDIESGLNFLRAETKRFQEHCRKCILDGKKEHERLTQDGFRLQTMLKECHTNVQKMQQELVVEKRQLQTMEQSSDKKVQTMQNDMVLMKKSIEELSAAIAAQTPGYEQTELEFQQRVAAYDATKKDLVALKNRKHSLEDQIRAAKNAIQQLSRQQGDLRDQLKMVRTTSVDQLKGNLDELQRMEKDIYTVDSKLAKAGEENSRFSSGITGLQEELQYVDNQKQSNAEQMEKLKIELEEIRRRLVKEWLTEDEIQRTVTVRDSVTVRNLDRLRRDTGNRELVVTGVTDRIQSELNLLADFLERVAQRRPKDTEKLE